jgi:hypothetical protein
MVIKMSKKYELTSETKEQETIRCRLCVHEVQQWEADTKEKSMKGENAMTARLSIDCTPWTNRIVAGVTDFVPGSDVRWFTSTTTDLTDEAVDAVFRHFLCKASKTGYYEVEVEGVGKLKFEKWKDE